MKKLSFIQSITIGLLPVVLFLVSAHLEAVTGTFSSSTSTLASAREVLMSYSTATSSITDSTTSISSSIGSSYKVEGGGWSSSRRRRKSPPPSTKPKKNKTPSNTFLVAVDDIEKAVFEAEASDSRYSHNTQRLSKLRKYIKLAAENKSWRFARHSIGHGIFSALKIGSTGKRSTINAAKSFMNSIKSDLGNKKFDSFMCVNGEISLMFVIDDTGSMSNEIQAAKDIARTIINHPRYSNVDYILSPFNDPKTGPLTYRPADKKSDFINDINSLKAHAGGDCPELTFKGMTDVFEMGPRYDSPMYVFTDASAKDATDDNMSVLLEMARSWGITINFFTTGLCGSSSFEPFKRVAAETCGQLFHLPSSSELTKLSGLTASALGGAACISSTNSNNQSGRKRGLAEYTIKVDDSIKTLIISVTTEKSSVNIRLITPMGTIQNTGKTSLTKVTIYELTNPRAGTWKLQVDSNAGEHEYVVKGVSPTNIDFEYFFIMVPYQGRYKKPIPVDNPLKGKRAEVMLTVAGEDKIDRNSLTLKFVTKEGKVLGSTGVKPRTTKGVHFTASFTPPDEPFKLRLLGKTKKGNTFERMSRGLVKAKPAIVRVLYARNEYTVQAGKRSIIMFTIENGGSSDTFDITVKDTLKYALAMSRNYSTVYSGRSGLFVVSFQAPSSATRGQTDTVFVSIVGRKSKVKSSFVVDLLTI